MQTHPILSAHSRQSEKRAWRRKGGRSSRRSVPMAGLPMGPDKNRGQRRKARPSCGPNGTQEGNAPIKKFEPNTISATAAFSAAAAVIFPHARCSRGCQSKSPAADSSGCRREALGFSRRGRSAVWVSRTCHRSTRPIQNALSLALRAEAARRRHSSARRRNSSTITSRPFADRSRSPLFRSGFTKLYQI
jgi:hypothetical protein